MTYVGPGRIIICLRRNTGQGFFYDVPFVQDNRPIHKSSVAKAWFQQHPEIMLCHNRKDTFSKCTAKAFMNSFSSRIFKEGKPASHVHLPIVSITTIIWFRYSIEKKKKIKVERERERNNDIRKKNICRNFISNKLHQIRKMHY